MNLPLADTIMRELLLTRYCLNSVRQIAANVLHKLLGQIDEPATNGFSVAVKTSVLLSIRIFGFTFPVLDLIQSSHF